MSFQYKPKSEKQLKAKFQESKRDNENDFLNLEDFLSWYEDQKKECVYCGLTECDSQEIVMTGILTSSRFPQNGIVGQGTNRGVFLEIDRKNPKGKYSRQNSVLCCYFCNNDKSDVFDSEDYKQFRQNRIAFLMGKLKR